MTTPRDDPRADDGLVEAMARAAFIAVRSGDENPEDWDEDDMEYYQRVMDDWDKPDGYVWPPRDTYRRAARAALTAARSHGGM